MIEILVFITIVVILFSIAVFVLSSFREKMKLSKVVERVVIILETARTKTVGSQDDSQYGVYFDDQSDPDMVVLFMGSSYSSRDLSFDENYSFPSGLQLESVSLAGGDEVVFQKITGETSNQGSVTISSLEQPERTETIYIKSTGQVDMKESALPSDDPRDKDSRHVHFDYTRLIDTLIETMVLTFEYNGSNYEHEIVMDSNMRGEQFYWQGEIDVNGSSQRLIIQTRRLNDPDTEFCVHRDRRHNDKSLSVSLSGDTSGAIINYSADGLNTNSSSIYTEEIIWQ